MSAKVVALASPKACANAASDGDNLETQATVAEHAKKENFAWASWSW